ncbi:MAG TPA: winged helix-turn-helix domain-containing protein [Bryobacteraceae bacterium]|nr:winged helix-turn-helix domain-containing protein [Bryobacteraceae bacterium]
MDCIHIANTQAESYQDAHLELDFRRRTARVDSKPLVLTRKEYDLLALMVQNAGQLISRGDLLMRVWGYGPQIRTRTLDVHIRRLRKKLGPFCERRVETIFGVGYRFQSHRALEAGRSEPVLLAMGA